MQLKNDKVGKLVEAAVGASTLAVSVLAAYTFLVRPWHLRWGATDEEIEERLPGDEFVPNPENGATHAITINAPVAEVWPWLLQVGQTKGGFYSYTWLENLVGCEMHNADEIVPEWQTLRTGDVVWLHPEAPPLPVIFVEPERAIVLGDATDKPESKGIGTGTWGFYLKDVDENTTRLIMRNRWMSKPGLLSWVGNYILLEPAHFIMERKMMLGIKQRAEALAKRRREEINTSVAARTAAGMR
jgi:hypothetical protein